MIDPQPARVPQRRPQQLGEWLRLRAGQAPGVERQLGPVLAALVEPVGRGADADAVHEQILLRPGIGTARIHADREVRDQPDRHSGRQGGLLDGRELRVGEPLKPRVKIRLPGQPRQRP